MGRFKEKKIQKDVIIVSVGYYLRYNISYRETQEILYDWGYQCLSYYNLLLDSEIWQSRLSN